MALFFDLFKGDDGGIRVVNPFAPLSSIGPLCFVFQVGRPPGKGAALRGAGIVNRAAFTLFEENAVEGCIIFIK